MTDTRETPNAGQIAFWNESAGQTWVAAQDPLDRQLAPLGERAMAALAPAAGERVLDIGCGAGATSLALAAAVGPNGSVLGVDISAPLLEAARAHAADAPNVRFVEADAQTSPFEAGAFDAAFSRFGVMFFADPTAAFANLRRALRAGGRLVFACWRTPGENPFMTGPAMAASALLPAPAGPPPDPTAPGPFAFADPERVRGILQGAGFEPVALEKLDLQLGGVSLQDALTLALRVGPLGARLRENPELAPRVRESVREVLAANLKDGQVWMPGAVWIVTAHRP